MDRDMDIEGSPCQATYPEFLVACPDSLDRLTERFVQLIADIIDLIQRSIVGGDLNAPLIILVALTLAHLENGRIRPFACLSNLNLRHQLTCPVRSWFFAKGFPERFDGWCDGGIQN